MISDMGTPAEMAAIDELEALQLTGGMRAGGVNASRPLISFRADGAGVRIWPRWQALGLFAPTFEFAWADVGRLVIITGVSGAQIGVRFMLTKAPNVTNGPLIFWRKSIRRPIVWLAPADLERVLAMAPPAIQRSRKRGVLFWPERN